MYFKLKRLIRSVAIALLTLYTYKRDNFIGRESGTDHAAD